MFLRAILLICLSLISSVSAFAQQRTFDPPAPRGSHGIVDLVNEQIRAKNLKYPVINSALPFLRSQNGADWAWPGAEHLPTLNKVCQILGYRTYVSSTCPDDERSGNYPNGKCNFHSPGNNELTLYDPQSDRFIWQSAEPKHAKTWISTITCKDPVTECSDLIDNDGDGKIDLNDPDCDSPDDDDEDRKPQCSDGIDNDYDNLIDAYDPGCWSDPHNPNSYDPHWDDESRRAPQCWPNDSQTIACHSGLGGICSDGTKTRQCNGYTYQWGAYSSCSANIQPGSINEHCSDGRDNDCDGLTDIQDRNDCSECSPGQQQHVACGNTGLQGVCSTGSKTRTCNSTGWWGSYGSCQATVYPGQHTEQCSDNLDNDCDGKVDGQDTSCYQCQPGDKTGVSCTTNYSGICQSGILTRTCLSNGTYSAPSACTPVVTPGQNPEVCNDNVDNDCDGDTDILDSDCFPTDTCQPGTTDNRSCSTSYAGECAYGLQYRLCLNSGQWAEYGDCYPRTYPGAVTEVCGDSLDNDCDGTVDNGCHSYHTPTPTPDNGHYSTKACSLKLEGTLLKGNLALDALRRLVNKAANITVKRLRNTPSTRNIQTTMKYGQDAPAACDVLYDKAQGVVTSIPEQYHSCTADGCARKDYSAQHNSYRASVGEMVKIARKISRGYNKAMPIKNRRLIKIRRKANTQKRSVFSVLTSVPTVTYSCD